MYKYQVGKKASEEETQRSLGKIKTKEKKAEMGSKT